MADDFSRTWVDFTDDLDAEALNDLEARQEARVTGNISTDIELGYQTNGTTFTTTSTAATGVDVTGMSVSVTVGTRPILVKMHADTWNSGAGFGASLYLREDGTNIGGMAGCIGDNFTPLQAERRLSPAAGAHTYSIRAKNNSAGTLTINAGAGTAQANSPMAIQVIEV